MRKTTQVKIGQDGGRDAGKLYLITEMPSAKSESWAMRALMALLRGGGAIPQELVRHGMAGLAEVGMAGLASLQWEDAEPLLAEMMDCVQIIPDPKSPNVVRSCSEEFGDIEEVSTRLKLRAEVWKLHMDFLKAGSSSDSDRSRPAQVKSGRSR